MIGRIAVGALLLTGASAGSFYATSERPIAVNETCNQQAICLRWERFSDRTKLSARNVADAGVRTFRLTFDGDWDALIGEPAGTVEVGPRETVPLLTATLANGEPDLTYRYWNIVGRTGTQHDRDARYVLPFRPSRRTSMGQSCGGAYSHDKASSLYALDIWMPEGTPIHAARAGRVVMVREHFREGGRSRRFYNRDNRVLIEHEDGTLAAYLHLKHDGARVDVGDHVDAGDVIALSGNTGWSSRPHLHFAVVRIGDDLRWRSLRVELTHAEKTYDCPRRGTRFG